MSKVLLFYIFITLLKRKQRNRTNEFKSFETIYNEDYKERIKNRSERFGEKKWF